MYFTTLRTVMGVADVSSPADASVDELIKQFVLNIPEAAPMLPIEFKTTAKEMKEVYEFFAQLYVLNMYELILTGNSGSLAATLSNIMDDRRLLRNETWSGVVKDGIEVVSIAWEAFLVTSAMFRDWAKSKDIFFVGDSKLTYNVKNKLNDFVFQLVGQYNTFLPSTNQRYLQSAAHVVNYTIAERGNLSFDFTVSDTAITFKDLYPILDKAKMTQFALFVNREMSGTNMDADLGVDRRLMKYGVPLKYIYKFGIPRPSLYGGAVMSLRFGIKHINEIYRDSDIANLILENATPVVIYSAASLADRFDVPDDMAEDIFKEKGPGVYYDLNQSSLMIFTFSPSTAPAYEVTSIDTGRLYVPFVAEYPYICTIERDMHELVITPLKLSEPFNK